MAEAATRLTALAERIELWPLDRLRPYERNPRTHSEDQVAQLAASMVEFCFTNPILVDETSGILAGHGRLMAARQLGLNEVPVVRRIRRAGDGSWNVEQVQAAWRANTDAAQQREPGLRAVPEAAVGAVKQTLHEQVDRARAVSMVFRLARNERDAWSGWPARIAAVLAAELGCDTHHLQTVLDRHVREHLDQLAEPRLELR